MEAEFAACKSANQIRDQKDMGLHTVPSFREGE